FTALGVLCFNGARRIKTRRPLFSGEEKNPLKRFLALMLGYKISVSDVLAKRDFYFPLEVFVFQGGVLQRNFKISARLTEDDPYRELERLVNMGVVNKNDEIWVSPAIPLILNISLGFLIALLYGDLVLLAVRLLVGF
ncbi:MAG: A24 family peptidase C-terminal domain-containing protein, partial [Desulfurococcaceae archaeon]